MTPREMDILATLLGGNFPSGARPQAFGGTTRSHHALTATRMVAKGWLERNFGAGWGKPRANGMERGSCRYRVTRAGRTAYENARAAKSLEATLAAASPARRRELLSDLIDPQKG